MWIFEAYYYNPIRNLVDKRDICFQESFSDKEAYLEAMARAYDMKKENESLEKLELIAC